MTAFHVVISWFIFNELVAAWLLLPVDLLNSSPKTGELGHRPEG